MVLTLIPLYFEGVLSKERKEIKKKILTVMLSFAMVLCMIPGMVFAEDTPTTPINGTAITLAQSSYEYTGSAVEPKVAVTLNGHY
ncbi:hypothetical protein D1151_16225 [Emergencia sp. 1XD21-10]|nr:hypothetical protein [Emergencia sp. 1XD21-10]